MNPGTYYVPEGEERTLTVVGVRTGNEEAEPLCFVDGSALFLLCTVEEASTETLSSSSSSARHSCYWQASPPGPLTRVKW